MPSPSSWNEDDAESEPDDERMSRTDDDDDASSYAGESHPSSHQYSTYLGYDLFKLHRSLIKLRGKKLNKFKNVRYFLQRKPFKIPKIST